VVTLVALALPASAATPPQPPASARLPSDIAAVLAGRSTIASVVVQDLRTGRVYSFNAGRRYDTASIVKVTIMAAALRQAAAAHRFLTATELTLLRRMITVSDNNAASSLWSHVGGSTGIAAFLRLAGMDATTRGSGGYWGLTQTTAGTRHTSSPNSPPPPRC